MAATPTLWRLLPASLTLLVLLCASPFLRFYAHNIHEGLSPGEISFYALLFTTAVLGLYGLLHASFRPQTPRFVCAFGVGLFACVSYYDIVAGLAEREYGFASQNAAWLALTIALLACAIAFGAKRGFLNFLLLYGTLSILLPSFTIATYDLPRGAQLPLTTAYPLSADEVWSGKAVRSPNLYWLVADSYPNWLELKQQYDYDNEGFLESLEQLGFYVAREAYSNFSTTRLSVPSTLNMEYVVEEGEAYSQARGDIHVRLPGNTNSGQIAAIAGDNRTVAYARQLGYRYIHYEGKSFHLTRCRGREDRCIRGAGLSDLQLKLISLLPIRALLGLVNDRPPPLLLQPSPSESGTGIPELAQALEQDPPEPPFFLYAHFASPHPPFYVDAHCQRSPNNYPINSFQFTQQLQCVNQHLSQLLKQIIAADPDAIILLSSDHGPRLATPPGLPTHALEPFQVRESLSILQALRLPPECRRGLHPRLSPVNSMRVIFACLGGHPPRLIEAKHFIVRPSADRGRVRQVKVH